MWAALNLREVRSQSALFTALPSGASSCPSGSSPQPSWSSPLEPHLHLWSYPSSFLFDVPKITCLNLAPIWQISTVSRRSRTHTLGLLCPSYNSSFWLPLQQASSAGKQEPTFSELGEHSDSRPASAIRLWPHSTTP